MKKKWKEILEKWFALYSQEEKEYKEKTKIRANLLFLLVAVILIAEIGVLYLNSGYQKGLNAHADLYKEVAITDGNLNTIVPGDVCDRNQECLVENTKKDGERISIYKDDYAYTQVIGFTGKQTANIVDNEVKVQGDGKDYRGLSYWKEKIYETTNKDSSKGNSLVLTLDHELQMKVQELMIQELGAEENGTSLGLSKKGSAVVMNAKTGEILAMVSFPTLNANTPNASFNVLYNEALKDLELAYPISHKGWGVEGSIFKVIMAVSLIDHGMQDYITVDNDFLIENAKIVNDYGSAGDEIDYHEAIVRSSNVFFAKAAVEMGGEALDETAKAFMLGENIELDFGTINQNWNLNVNDDVDVAQTAFGQGKTLWSTMIAAMVTQTIANDGVMLKPYMVHQVISENGEVVERGKTEVLNEVTSAETADKVTSAMVAATEDHISIVEGEAAKNVYQTYSIASKTGTGENGDDTNNAWFISFASADENDPDAPTYVVVINEMNTDKYGYRMMDTAAEIYRYLFEENR